MAFIYTEDRNKWIVGATLLGFAAVLLIRGLWPSSPPAAARTPRPGIVPMLDNTAPTRPRPQTASRARRTEAPSGVSDPKLRLDLLAKAQGVTYSGTERNIFQYHTPPPPPPPKPAVNPVTAAAKKNEPPKPPPPPPIPLKYYGFAHRPADTVKKAFFVEGEEIYIAGEGEIVNKRYRINKIGVNTVEVEDIVTKHKQTLPLQES